MVSVRQRILRNEATWHGMLRAHLSILKDRTPVGHPLFPPGGAEDYALPGTRYLTRGRSRE